MIKYTTLLISDLYYFGDVLISPRCVQELHMKIPSILEHKNYPFVEITQTTILFTHTSAKSRKRKSKMESTLEIFADKITSALKNDESELLLKMQAAQHEHDLKVLYMLTQLITRQQPPFYQQAVQAPHLYCPTQSSVIHSPPYPMASSQSPLFEMSNQSLSFQQDLAQPLPFGNALPPSHNPGQPFRPERPNPRDQAQHASFNQAFMSSYPPPDEQD